MTHRNVAPGLVDTAELTARIEAMFERGQVRSEPRVPSNTDQMLDRLFARSPKRMPLGRRPAGGARPDSPQPATDAPGARRSSWLDLPSLEELIERRLEMLHRPGERRMLELDAEPGAE